MIIDRINNLELSDAEVEQRSNELGALKYLSDGLNFLGAQGRLIEEEVKSRIVEDLQVHVFGNHPLLKEVPQSLVACSFHWNSVTACIYVKLAGWLANGIVYVSSSRRKS